MKPATLALGLLLATAPALHAQDADGDGMVTMDELVAAFPDLTEDVFTAADTNGDGALDADEIAAAQEAGVLPPAEM